MGYLIGIVVFFSLSLQGNPKGFSPQTFWNSMEWKRDNSPKEFRENRDIQQAEKNFYFFCQKLEKLSPIHYEAPPLVSSIPPILHFIWIGSELTPQAKVSIDSWKKHHPKWEIKIWTDQEITDFSWTDTHSKYVFEEAKTFAEKADVLRLEILYQFGGIYSDVDVLCLRSFHDLILQKITFFSSFELNYTSSHHGEALFVGTAIMGAQKGSSLIKSCLDNCKTEKECPGLGILKRTGPSLVSHACRQALYDPKENILILPCSYVYPFPWKKRKENAFDFISPESLAIHLWDNSWMK